MQIVSEVIHGTQALWLVWSPVKMDVFIFVMYKESSAIVAQTLQQKENCKYYNF
jgi:hypothetical protein